MDAWSLEAPSAHMRTSAIWIVERLMYFSKWPWNAVTNTSVPLKQIIQCLEILVLGPSNIWTSSTDVVSSYLLPLFFWFFHFSSCLIERQVLLVPPLTNNQFESVHRILNDSSKLEIYSGKLSYIFSSGRVEKVITLFPSALLLLWDGCSLREFDIEIERICHTDDCS